MPKTNYRLRKSILALLCLSALLFNGCTLTISTWLKSHSTDTGNVKANTDKPRTEQAAAKHDMPIAKTNKAENKSFFVLGKEYISEGSTTDGDEELEVLEKVRKLEARMEEEKEERMRTGIQVKELNQKISDLQAEEAAVAAKPGSGYLAEGSTIKLGIIDGDDELQVLNKIKRLESRLENEKNKVKLLNKEMADLQSAKESIEKDFANTKKLLQDESSKLSEKINALESTLEETKSRAIAAEQDLNPVKKELLKTQISETKAQQEIYKLRIQKLKKDEE